MVDASIDLTMAGDEKSDLPARPRGKRPFREVRERFGREFPEIVEMVEGLFVRDVTEGVCSAKA
jgi:hypothetical protein